MENGGENDGRRAAPNWDPYVDEILDLLVLQNKTFAHVKAQMEAKHRFMAT
jgi:hypothetical protein